MLISDRDSEQAPVHHGQANDLPGQLVREGLHQEEEQVVSNAVTHQRQFI